MAPSEIYRYLSMLSFVESAYHGAQRCGWSIAPLHIAMAARDLGSLAENASIVLLAARHLHLE
jgi:hypothetical protein